MPLVNVVNTPQVKDALLWLLTFSDPYNDVVLRAVNNIDDVTSNGLLYTAFPFELVLPPDDGQSISKLNLSFPNVGRELMELVRGYPPGFYPQVRFDLVIYDEWNPTSADTIEKTIDFMRVTNVTYDANAITFELTSSSVFARKTCVATYTQAEFPGMFWGLG